MSIFENIDQNNEDPPREDETAFAYLNRSNRIEAARVRALVDHWLDNYPAQHRNALVARFRSGSDPDHLSAFFELFLHELVLRCGHRVVAIEPSLDHTPSSPDFLIESNDGSRFYFEGTLATGRSQQERGEQARLNQALAAIDAVPCPAHFLDLEIRNNPTAPITIRRMTRELRAWIGRLPEGESAPDAAPFTYQEHGAQIVIRAWPRQNRHEADRSIGVRSFGATTITPDDDIRAALKRKASKYGCLDHPYVVAVNALGVFQHEGNCIDALLGSERVVVRPMPNGERVGEISRNPDGIWNGPRGAQNRRISAVFSTERIDPWNFAQRHARLMRNPWAVRELPPVSLRVDELNPDGGRFRRTNGDSLASIFELTDQWPG
ncbi:hypothetical protein [Methylocystis rosea]|uniref:Uncharacterized protein n=1 Tax=Methylocystis rosea TaxID=173366 RepID=A0A3G8M481_9HYPH|nr:hypothetical protein [Methylocystis rosea]AZG75912.1 hypothetical protein EHO51_03700 [Methylocystis rosea]